MPPLQWGYPEDSIFPKLIWWARCTECGRARSASVLRGCRLCNPHDDVRKNLICATLGDGCVPSLIRGRGPRPCYEAVNGECMHCSHMDTSGEEKHWLAGEEDALAFCRRLHTGDYR